MTGWTTARPSVNLLDAPETYPTKVSSHVAVANGAGRLAWTGGIVGFRPDGTLPETLLEQVDQTMTNLANIVSAAGASPYHITQVTLYAIGWTAETAFRAQASFQKLLGASDGKTHRPAMALIPVTALATPQLKFEVIATLAIPGSGHSWNMNSSLTLHAPPKRKFDVVVVGAGFAGLQAAVRAHEAGLSVLVLEARHCIGGRSCTVPLKSDKGVVELGATWINPATQPVISEMVKRFHLETLEIHQGGVIVIQSQNGCITKNDPQSAQERENEQKDIDTATKSLANLLSSTTSQMDIQSPSAWVDDPARTMKQWMESKKLDEATQFRLSATIMASSGTSVDKVGAHYILDHIKSAEGFLSVATDGPQGAQGLRIRKGTRAIADGLASDLPGDSILLQTAVRSVEQYGESVIVETGNGEQIEAKKAALVSQTIPGTYAKVVLTYLKPWWRDTGLSGNMISFKGPILYTRDVSVPSENQFSLAAFISGPNAMEWINLDSLKRQTALLAHLTELLGSEYEEKIHDLLEINSVTWSSEKFIETGPTTSMGPGLLSRYGNVLREPFKNVHFAGTETAYEWKGYLEGALSSGIRAAGEVKLALKK